MGLFSKGGARRPTGSSSKYIVRKKNGEIFVENKNKPSRGGREDDFDGPSGRRHFDDEDKYGGPSRGRQEPRRMDRDDYEDRGHGRQYEARRPQPKSYDDEYTAPRRRPQTRRVSPDEDHDYGAPKKRGNASRRPSPEDYDDDEYSPPPRPRLKPRALSPDYDDDYSPPRRTQPKARRVSPDYDDEYRGRGARPRPQRYEPSDDEDEDEYGGGRPPLIPLSFQVRDQAYDKPRKPTGPRLRRISTDSECSERQGGGGGGGRGDGRGGGGGRYASRAEPELVEIAPRGNLYKRREVFYPDEVEEPD